MPFIRADDGELVAGEAQERQAASAAISAARSMAATNAGPVDILACSAVADRAIGEAVEDGSQPALRVSKAFRRIALEAGLPMSMGAAAWGEEL